MKFAIILNNKAHQIFEQDTTLDFPPDPQGNPIVVLDITNNPRVQEGWSYDEATGTFSEPVIEHPITEDEPAPLPSDIDLLREDVEVLKSKVGDMYDMLSYVADDIKQSRR